LLIIISIVTGTQNLKMTKCNLLKIFQGETDFNEEDEKSPFGISNEIIREREIVENENQESLNPELITQESAIDVEDAKKETGTEEIIDIDKVSEQKS